MSQAESTRWVDTSPKMQELMAKVHSLQSAVLNQDKLRQVEPQVRTVL